MKRIIALSLAPAVENFLIRLRLLSIERYVDSHPVEDRDHMALLYDDILSAKSWRKAFRVHSKDDLDWHEFGIGAPGMIRKLLGIVVAVFLSGFIFSGGYLSYAQEQDISSQARGYVSPMPEEHKLFVDTHPRISQVLPNKLGLERINNEKRNKGLPPLSEEGVISIQGADLISALPGKPSAKVSMAAASVTSLPPFVDNSQLPAFPPIRDRGSLASCTAMASTYFQMTHMAGLMYGWNNKNEDNTTKFSPRWTYNFLNQGSDVGIGFYEAFNVMEAHGAATWAEFPYDGTEYKQWSLDTMVWERAIKYRINPIQTITDIDTTASLDQLKTLLNNGYIVSFGTYIMGWSWTAIKDDPSTPDDDPYVGKGIASYATVNPNSGHSMVIVGYDDRIWCDINGNGRVDPGEKGALKIANGNTGWQDNGFAWVAYDALKQVSGVSGGPSRKRVPLIDYKMVYVMTLRDHYQPKLLAKFTVNHAKRNQLLMYLGTSETSSSIPLIKWYPGAFSFRGGALAFNGTKRAVDGTFVFDLTDILTPPGNTPKRYYLGVYDSTAGNPARLLSFKLKDMINNIESADALTSNLDVDAGQVQVPLNYTFAPSAPAITNNPPVVTATVSPLSGRSPLTVNFTGSAMDTDGTITNRVWVFGDNMKVALDGAITPVAQYQYTKAGVYFAKFMATDNSGAESSDIVFINVSKKLNIFSWMRLDHIHRLINDLTAALRKATVGVPSESTILTMRKPAS